ncbi:MAG: beta-galactosidase [Clostridia bacterium]|nr:beta-galactosidase [Clostridia bacterium]
MERLIKVGKITPKKSVDIKKSRIGLGFEKLDRDVFDPEKAYAFVAETGVKWARLQSGWQRTEREKGVYNFAWLDAVVDNMLAIGVEPWLCLCYGNDLYSEEAKKYFGAVGVPPIHTEEERQAWVNYVTATVAHFKGRVHYYEVWNEPNGKWCWKHGPNAQELAEFTKRTALACKAADPTCEVIGLALCALSFNTFTEEVAAVGTLDYLDGISYHAYSVNDQIWKDRIEVLKNIRTRYNKPTLKIFQGESGTQSRSDGAGALRGGAWTQTKQAKFLLRHLITDIGCGVEFASYFSCMDMIEALNGMVGDVASYLDYGYFGVLGADFDENGRASGTYTPKPSYYALQNLCSVLAEEYEVCALPGEWVSLDSVRLQGMDLDPINLASFCFKRENGALAMMYWVPKNILTETYEGTVSFQMNEYVRGRELYLTDLMDGMVYKLSDAMQTDNGVLKNIPIADRPFMLTFGEFCDWEEIK